MPSFPLNAAILIGPCVLLVFSAVYIAAWLHAREKNYLLYFAAGCILYVFAALSQALFWPVDADLNEVVSASFYILAMMSIVEALLRRTGKRGGLIFHAALFGILMSMTVYFTYVHRSVTALIYIMNLGSGTGLLICLVRITDLLKGGLFDKVLFWAFAIFALHFFPRTILTASPDITSGIQQFTETTFFTAMNISVTVLAVALALAILASTAADIIESIKRQQESDPITGLLDQSGFLRRGETLLDGKNQPLALIITGIDNLHRINQQFGHSTGDDMLRAFAAIIRDKIRTTDTSARLGEEDFAILLGQCDAAQARVMAENIRDEACVAWHANPHQPTFCISFGSAQWQEGEALHDMIERASDSLREARRTARNETVVASITSIDSTDDGESDFRF